MDTIDLDAYLDRIEYGGDLRPSYETLTALIQAHTAKIPFENLDVLFGRPIKLDLAGVQDKLVANRRGGYCFEHGTLFAAALQKLGFACMKHAARVTLFVPRDQAPRTHMFLTVALPDGRYVVDPGFGGLAPRFPLPLPGDSSQMPHEASGTHILVRDERFTVLRVVDAGKTTDAWSSTLEPEYEIDFILANHYTSAHPNSPFVNRVFLRAFCGDQVVSVMNRDVTIRKGGAVQTLQLEDRLALRSLVAHHFGFDLPEIERIKVPSVPEWA